mmetsp:Transcript_88304/g.274470  ORF Transcript_88304/g.274470 Transcript_88304/m.274470 type:complete len:205 (-) Transcript_88304:5-619(-)
MEVNTWSSPRSSGLWSLSHRQKSWHTSGYSFVMRVICTVPSRSGMSPKVSDFTKRCPSGRTFCRESLFLKAHWERTSRTSSSVTLLCSRSAASRMFLAEVAASLRCPCISRVSPSSFSVPSSFLSRPKRSATTSVRFVRAALLTLFAISRSKSVALMGRTFVRSRGEGLKGGPVILSIPCSKSKKRSCHFDPIFSDSPRVLACL